MQYKCRKFLIIIGALLLNSALFAQNFHIYCEDDKPAQYIGPDGKLTGMVVEMVREIQKRVGNKDEIQMVPWARGLNELNTTPNTLLFSMARTEERNSLYQWIGPIFAESVFGFYVKSTSKIKIRNLEDAKKVGSIGVYRGDVRDQFLTSAGFKNLERGVNNVNTVKKLMGDRIDLYAGTENDVKDNAEQAGFKASDLKLVYVFLKSQIFIAVSKSTSVAEVAKWNKALDKMKSDGTFKVIFKKYYPNDEPPGSSTTTFSSL